VLYAKHVQFIKRDLAEGLTAAQTQVALQVIAQRLGEPSHFK
jgi:hypothetical protein